MALFLMTPSARAVTSGVIDTFQDGTVQGWAGAGVSNVPNAGPLGAGDNALEVPNGGRGIVAYNEAQWSGNYLVTGINKISLDVQNPNDFDLQLRLGISKGFRPGPTGSGATYVTSSSVAVPSDGLWHRIMLSLNAADLSPAVTNTEGAPNAAAAMSDVAHLRILHNPTPNEFTAAGVGSFRLDNITAVPEPTALTSMSVVGAWLVMKRRNVR